MLARAHQELRAWVDQLAADADLEVADGIAGGDQVVRLRLGGIVKDDPNESGRAPGAMPLLLRYVVSVAATPVASLKFLEGFLLALRARQRSFLRLELDPFDLVPRLTPDEVGVVVDVAVVAAPEPVLTELVTKPIVLDTGGLSRLSGVVRGHGSPLAGAEVVLVSLGTATRTDSKGRFTFSRVPAHPEVQSLSIEVKGRMFHADADVAAGEPVVINCDL